MDEMLLTLLLQMQNRLFTERMKQMENEKKTEYKVDPIFDRYVQPYDKSSSQQLLSAVLEDIDGRVVHVWNGCHLNDKTKYDLCKEHGINVKIKEYNFNSRNSAAYYICTKEINRDDLCDDYRKYLVGQMFHYKELIESGDVFRRPVGKNKMAAEIGVSIKLAGGTVLKYNQYSDAMDIIFERDPDFARKILMGVVKVSQENVIELSRLRTEEIRAIAKVVEEERLDKLTLADIRNEIRWYAMRHMGGGSVRVTKAEEKKIPKTGTIRQMPEYDPDSEVNSLCMTISSWISSIKRVNDNADFGKITMKARLRLGKQLVALVTTIDEIQKSLEERTGSYE